MKRLLYAQRPFGFTLTEILMTVVIIGALAGLAVPNFRKSVEVARSQEARGNLQQIYQGQLIYKLNNGAYYVASSDPAVVDAALKTSLKTEYYTLAISGDGSSFTANETRDGCPGKFFEMTPSGMISENGGYC